MSKHNEVTQLELFAPPRVVSRGFVALSDYTAQAVEAAESVVEGGGRASRLPRRAGGTASHLAEFNRSPSSGSRVPSRTNPVLVDARILRPVQYLGNKQRSLSQILDVVQAFVQPGDVVFDLFTGTSVVAQGLAMSGLQVHAVDASSASCAMASAALGIGRKSSTSSPTGLFGLLEAASESYEDSLISAFHSWVIREDDALRVRDGAQLLEVGLEVPQVWRPGYSGRLATVLSTWTTAAEHGEHHPALISAVYAGSYFGVRQALTIDACRSAIRDLATSRTISSWEEQVLITALLAAASAAAFSPGKHFAQPHKIGGDKDLSFHSQRVVSDRQVDIRDTVRSWTQKLFRSLEDGIDHRVLEQPVESIRAEDLRAAGARLVYADPPYTAQQYSRFYHVLDTLTAGTPRPLQIVRGRVTTGLYPVGRYLSPFCSKRLASQALSQLATESRKAGACLAFSYSVSRPGSNGNERMISLRQLCDALSAAYGKSAVELVELDHRYRQFNHATRSRTLRLDPEVLVVAHAA